MRKRIDVKNDAIIYLALKNRWEVLTSDQNVLDVAKKQNCKVRYYNLIRDSIKKEKSAALMSLVSAPMEMRLTPAAAKVG